jgi:hypothetical protein
VIQPVETTPAPEPQTQASPTPADPTSGGTDFASLHAAAVAREKPAAAAGAGTATAAGTAAPTASATPRSERVAAPEGETWASTKAGAHYARIVTGPRTGEYINLTHGDRRGETFSIEKRNGQMLHVYKESGTEVEVKPADDASATTNAAKRVKHQPADRPPAGERWAPVVGHNNYADILEGPRNGLYVNISGGVRDGMAFQIVKKGEKVFHVYGTGKDKQTIDATPKKHKAPSSAAATGNSAGSTASSPSVASAEGTTPSGGTGGTAAPSAN